MRAFIFGAGVYDRQTPDIAPGDLVIAADGGLKACLRLGAEPDIVIGDFDSLGYVPEGDRVRLLPVEKDLTDLHAAADAAVERGCAEIMIYGGMGGRPDHTLANVSLLAELSRRGVRAVMFGEGYAVTAVTDARAELRGEKDKTVSVFAFSETAEGVTYEGLYYPLRDAVLRSDRCIGVSNKFTGDAASVSVKKGTLIIAVEQ